MASRVVSGTIAAVVLVLCVWGCSSDSGETEKTQSASPDPASQTSPQATPSKPAEPEKEITVDLGDDVTMKMVLIPAGEFMMGSHESAEELAKRFDTEAEFYKHERPQHRVKITKPFYLGVYEVTQQQYEKVMGDKPWSGESLVKEGPEYPATFVSWRDTQEFCRKLSSREGRTYRLPTEAEWEYACRAGSKTRYCFGDDESELGTYAWYAKITDAIDETYAHRVGTKGENAWGLYDMHGNVWEWCQDWCRDWFDDEYYAKSPPVDPTGPSTGSYHVFRGGSWGGKARICRSANRNYRSPGYRHDNLGFRVALVPSE